MNTNIFYKLVATHFYIARKKLLDKIINLYIWVFCTLVIIGYVMQQFGLAANFGPFQLASVLGTVGLFEVYGNIFGNIADFEGDRHIDYYLTLPVQSSTVWWSMICCYSVVGIILTLLVLPFGKLLLFQNFSLATISWLKFLIILILANIFYGVFTLFITAQIGTVAQIYNLWPRFIFPLWFLGGFQFSWASIYALSAPLAYVLLCNPIIFIMEGMRSSLLHAQDCLPWALCCVALCGYIIVGWFCTKYKIKQLLDLV